jgi:hypothetical protein
VNAEPRLSSNAVAALVRQLMVGGLLAWSATEPTPTTNIGIDVKQISQLNA